MNKNHTLWLTEYSHCLCSKGLSPKRFKLLFFSYMKVTGVQGSSLEIHRFKATQISHIDSFFTITEITLNTVRERIKLRWRNASELYLLTNSFDPFLITWTWLKWFSPHSLYGLLRPHQTQCGNLCHLSKKKDVMFWTVPSKLSTLKK